MQIPTEPNLSVIERFMGDLIGEQPDRTMTIPSGLRHLALGVEASLVQLLLTWAQQQQRPRLTIGAESEAQVENLVRQMTVMSGGLVCDEAVDSSGANIFPTLRRSALRRLDQIQGHNARSFSRGPQIEIVCADHLNRSTPVSLYVKGDEGEASLKTRPGFSAVAKAIGDAVVPEAYRPFLDPQFLPALGDALYEIFRNTEDHARRDENGDTIARSLRGLQARRHSLTPQVMRDLAAPSKPLADYCERLEPPRVGKAQIELVEISVFDAGPGFAPRWLKRRLADIGFEEEGEAVADCFGRHATSKSVSGAGQGLSNVIEILRQQNGFLRLRTGRQSLFADLGKEQNMPLDASVTLEHWRPAMPQMAPVTGSLLTFLLPLSLGR